VIDDFAISPTVGRKRSDLPELLNDRVDRPVHKIYL
jgi:hypothetical protein